jgi:hypothetical protein
VIWLHDPDSPAVHSLRRRTWDGAVTDCERTFPNTAKTGPLREWSKPCEDCFRAREAKDRSDGR